MDKTELLQKKCQICEIGGSPMPDDERDKAFSAVEGWELKEGTKIKKEFGFGTFRKSMEFVNKIADLAEEEGHHPSIFISYNKVRITLSTHSVGGLTENDFIMAAKIDILR